jgi:hypothetical protein
MGCVLVRSAPTTFHTLGVDEFSSVQKVILLVGTLSRVILMLASIFLFPYSYASAIELSNTMLDTYV